MLFVLYEYTVYKGMGHASQFSNLCTHSGHWNLQFLTYFLMFLEIQSLNFSHKIHNFGKKVFLKTKMCNFVSMCKGTETKAFSFGLNGAYWKEVGSYLYGISMTIERQEVLSWSGYTHTYWSNQRLSYFTQFRNGLVYQSFEHTLTSYHCFRPGNGNVTSYNSNFDSMLNKRMF